MIKHAAEINLLESLRYRVRVLGKGESNPSTMYRVRKGTRGRDSILDEQGLIELVERERAGQERKAVVADDALKVNPREAGGSYHPPRRIY